MVKKKTLHFSLRRPFSYNIYICMGRSIGDIYGVSLTDIYFCVCVCDVCIYRPLLFQQNEYNEGSFFPDKQIYMCYPKGFLRQNVWTRT